MDGVVDWDGIGIMEISGSKRVGKSVSSFSLSPSQWGCSGVEVSEGPADILQLLALYAAIQLLVHDDTAVCRWIDTEGSFNPSRIAKIVEQMDDQVLVWVSTFSGLMTGY